MSGILINGPKRLSRYSSFVMCRFAVSGEVLRILEGYWRIVKYADVQGLPMYSNLVGYFIRLGGRGLAILVLTIKRREFDRSFVF